MHRIADSRRQRRPGRSAVVIAVNRPRRGLRGALACAWTAAAFAAAAEQPLALDGSLQTISGPGWTIAGLSTRFEIDGGRLRGLVQIGALALAGWKQPVTAITVECDHVVLTTHRLACDDGRISADVPGIGPLGGAGSFAWSRTAAVLDIDLEGLAVAGGNVALAGTASPDRLDLRFAGAGLQLEGLLEIARAVGLDRGDLAAAGSVSAEGTVRLDSAAAHAVTVTGAFSGTSFSNDAGTIAGDGLAGTYRLDLELAGTESRIGLELSASAGEAYLEPVYANFAEHAFELAARQVATEDFSRFELPDFTLRQESLLDLHGFGRLQMPDDAGAPMRLSAELAIADAALDTVYSSLLQVRLAGTILGNLQTDGRLSGTVVLVDNSPTSLALQFDDLIIDDEQGRFAIYGLGGEIDWPGTDRVPSGGTQLHWDSASIYTILLGEGEVRLALGDDDVELLSPLRLQTMGGALQVNRFALRDFGSDAASGLLDAELEPVQLGQLTSAFGWPAFSGQLSGRLPLLQLAGDTITVGGSLTARAFDGDVEIANLRIEHPFGRVPRLQADVTMRGLDLERLTDTFSFGLIQGRLSGDVTGLQLVNWRPVAMDMHFYTPQGDRSRRRISQRAVEDLASVGGGGAGAVLSTGMLQFFDVFSYERIGLRCVLDNGVCRMSGAGQAAEGPEGRGYYIVKGSGLPRIDVVGYRDRVNWSRLLRQLGEITRGRSPAVE